MWSFSQSYQLLNIKQYQTIFLKFWNIWNSLKMYFKTSIFFVILKILYIKYQTDMYPSIQSCQIFLRPIFTIPWANFTKISLYKLYALLHKILWFFSLLEVKILDFKKCFTSLQSNKIKILFIWGRCYDFLAHIKFIKLKFTIYQLRSENLKGVCCNISNSYKISII